MSVPLEILIFKQVGQQMYESETDNLIAGRSGQDSWRGWLGHGLKAVLPPVFCLVAGIIVWDLVIRFGNIDRYLLPTPWAVMDVLLGRSGDLLCAAWITFCSALTGFVFSLVTGLLVATLFSEFRWFRQGCYPYAIFLHTVPIVAISPLIITWFGYGNRSVVVITYIVSLFPIITSATNGMLQASGELKELFQLYGASRWAVLWKLKLPSAIPQIISGAQTASGLAVVGAIVGEFFAGYEAGQFGLGYYIFSAQGMFRTDILLAAVLLSTLLGIGLFALVTILASTVLRRWTIR